MTINYSALVRFITWMLLPIGGCTDGGSDNSADRGSDCPVGSESCSCTPSGACDDGLKCLSGRCWDATDGTDTDSDSDTDTDSDSDTDTDSDSDTDMDSDSDTDTDSDSDTDTDSDSDTEEAPPGVPSIESFTASPHMIDPGGSSTLSWVVTGASSLSIDSSVGAVTAASGSTNVSPTATITTYTLTAANDHGSVTADDTVSVITQYVCPSNDPDGSYDLFVDGIPAFPRCADDNSNVYSDNGVDTYTSSGPGRVMTQCCSGGFQCTEFATRYFYFRWGMTGVININDNARSWCADVVTRYESVDPNHQITVRLPTDTPVHGDLAVWDFHDGGAGHIAVVDTVNSDGSITVVEQNYSSMGNRRTTFDTVECYLHAATNPNSK